MSGSNSISESVSRSRERSRSRPRNKQIFVTRISRRTSSQDLRDVFRRYGRIRNVSMKRSYAFIEYTDSSDAQYAVRKMNGREVDGSRLVVQIAGEKRREPRYYSNERRRGPQKDDLCYNCQEYGHWANECRNPRRPRRHSRSRSPRRRSYSPRSSSERDKQRKRQTSESKSKSSSSPSKNKSVSKSKTVSPQKN